jgi:DNA modification methylase
VWLKALTDEGDVVCDCFAGTRTTERNALALNRRSVAIDIYDWRSSI